MKRILTLLLCGALLLSGCGTTAGEGAYVGGQFGAILGSAIGGISGGPRGSDLGTVVGVAGGAMIGAVIGSAAEKAQQARYEERQRERDARYGRHDVVRHDDSRAADGSAVSRQTDDSGFDPTNSGDDRITFDDAPQGYPAGGDIAAGSPAAGEVYTTVQPRTVTVEQLERSMPGYRMRLSPLIEICRPGFVDRDGDGIIRAGEECRVSFEIMNRSSMTVYDITPTVIETTGNKHIHISPSIRVESIEPGKGVRYTATVMADKRLKDGEAVIKVAVAQGDREITSQVEEFRVETRRK